ncbi:LysR family transcriptional regulator [Ruminococcaceae bacterium OttesenSCG-928-O06]|nr:LysR family transcriptional regulator [Ruminococcaceae bacterium OttesenSCG-928-O06]
MQIEHIRLFHLVASIGSISKAARESHISQPALSQQIQRLEQELGFQLLTRNNKGVELTGAGHIVAKYAERFDGLYDNLMEDLQDFEHSLVSIRIIASPVVGIYGLPCTMFQVKSDFPNVAFTLTTRSSREVEAAILQGEGDVGFIIGRPHEDELIAKEVYSDKVYLVAAKGSSVPDKVTLDMLQEYPLVVQGQKSSLHNQLEEYLLRIGRSFGQYNVLFSLDSAESVKSSVLQNHGLAFLPYLSIKKELYSKQLRQISLQGFDMSYEVYIVYKKKTDAADTVYRIATYFSEIGPETFC